MTYFLYDIVLSGVALIAGVWLLLSRRHRALLGRFAPPMPDNLPHRPVWIQACSVGEVTTAKPIIAAIRARWPEVGVLLTVSTASGYQWAQTTCDDTSVTWFPFDCRFSVRRFLRAVEPRALVLIETEIWPNILRETRRLEIPVVLMNGRLSDKHLSRYRSFRRFFRPVLANLSAAGMQNEEYADRVAVLGLELSRVHVTGCTKFDGVVDEFTPETLARLREENGLPTEDPVLIFGSTRPGDESLAAACWQVLREEFTRLHLVVAPRHCERIAEVEAAFDEPLLRRSAVLKGRAPAGERVFVLDTVGELMSFYAVSTVAVIGGSFYPGVNGHNPIEPAALGIPVVFGSYMRNFVDPARELVEHDAAIQVSAPDDLLNVLRGLLRDDKARKRMAECGRKTVRANQGAVARNLDLLATVLPDLSDQTPGTGSKMDVKGAVVDHERAC